jgi:3-hydroxybutyryl-CoA dehydrogenase
MGVAGIETLGVVGSGQMGAGVAHVASLNGYGVLLADVTEAAAEQGRDGIAKRMDRAVAKGRLDADACAAAVERIRPVGTLSALSDADFVVEAVTEKEELKFDIFRELDGVTREGVILASNTSSISITRIAAVTQRPDRVIGMHFMNPVPVMKLIEIIRGLPTSQATLDATLALGEDLGKTCVQSSDYPGFIVNRILMPWINEAFFALMEGVASAEDIDAAMTLGTNVPMGPFVLADFIGLDTCLAILEVLHGGLGDDKYRPCPLLRQHVDAGYFGRKVGRGVHDYGRKE